MKPNAPTEIRGPYKPIKTNVPGIEISENFPRMAKHADKYALIRSVYHTAAAVHDTGHQMMQTGRLFQGGIEYPHIGCVLSQAQRTEGRRAAARAAAPPHRQHRRQHAARAERRLPGQDLRSVRAQCRSVRPELQSARHAAAGLPYARCASTAARTGARWWTRPSATSRPRRTRGCSMPPSTRPTR